MTDAPGKSSAEKNSSPADSGASTSGNPVQQEKNQSAQRSSGQNRISPEEVQAKCMGLIESFRTDKLLYATAISYLSVFISNNVNSDLTSETYT
jgi:hypothetical protein